MKIESRGARGEKLAKGPDRNYDTAMKQFPWRNPLKGGNNIAMAEVRIKGAGMAVGFKVRF